MSSSSSSSCSSSSSSCSSSSSFALCSEKKKMKKTKKTSVFASFKAAAEMTAIVVASAAFAPSVVAVSAVVFSATAAAAAAATYDNDAGMRHIPLSRTLVRRRPMVTTMTKQGASNPSSDLYLYSYSSLSSCAFAIHHFFASSLSLSSSSSSLSTWTLCAKRASSSQRQRNQKHKQQQKQQRSRPNSAGKGQEGGGRQGDHRRTYPKGGPPPPGKATNILPASLLGISENHSHEQFFYRESCRRRLYRIVSQFDRPLLVCNPSLAIEAQRTGRPYLLLDRDTRFDFLPGYNEFDLRAPYLMPKSYNYDVIFVDPPFANVTPTQLARSLTLIAPDNERASVPVYVGYNSDRESELIDAFHAEYRGPALERKWSLEYESCTERTNDKIWLYGPVGPYPS